MLKDEHLQVLYTEKVSLLVSSSPGNQGPQVPETWPLTISLHHQQEKE